MKNTFGQNLTVTLFGESHGPETGVVIDGLTPGLAVDEPFIAAQLSRRRPMGAVSTARREPDRFSIVSGVFRGKTTGTPLCIRIPNEDTDSAAYDAVQNLPRPGHADYTAFCKYHGFQDHRGGGHFSGRLTAPLVAAGAVVIPALAQKGIRIGTHIARCGGVADRPFDDLNEDISRLHTLDFAVLEQDAAAAMVRAIEAAAADGDSVGGVLETAVIGLPAGVGEPWFDTVEGLLAHALFSIPAVKGVQFGAGFDMADGRGSRYNDAFVMEDGQVKTRTNHNGGVNGGVTNGMPLLFRCAVKPTPSIAREQQTVDLKRRADSTLRISGRHDSAIVHRARVVVDSLTALTLCDLLLGRYGTDWLGGAAE